MVGAYPGVIKQCADQQIAAAGSVLIKADNISKSSSSGSSGRLLLEGGI